LNRPTWKLGLKAAKWANSSIGFNPTSPVVKFRHGNWVSVIDVIDSVSIGSIEYTHKIKFLMWPGRKHKANPLPTSSMMS